MLIIRIVIRCNSQSLHIRHSIDVMHVEKNISASILGFILGDKDNLAVRKDLEDVGIRHDLHLRARASRGDYLKPQALYSLRPSETAIFLRRVGSIKVPSMYSSSMLRHLTDRKLHGLKSHDHHIIIQDILPASIRGLLHPGACDAVIRLGHCFKMICQKTIDPAQLSSLKEYVAETMCLLKVWFPPSFFDIMPHLLLHLVEELEWLGPVHSRWCYDAKRYLFVLKKYVRNRAKPEASIATGYMYAEALGFIEEHLSLYPGYKRIWDPEDDAKNNGEVLEGAPIYRQLTDSELRALHEFVITNSVHTEVLRRSVNSIQVQYNIKH